VEFKQFRVFSKLTRFETKVSACPLPCEALCWFIPNTGEVRTGVARHQRVRGTQVENVRAALDCEQVRDLLLALCVKLGFCLPPSEQEWIVSEPPLTVYDFTDAVFVGEGLDPATADKTLLNRVRMIVAAAFATSKELVNGKT
jgi:hypothetical protein